MVCRRQRQMCIRDRLIGIPLNIIVGNKFLENEEVELLARNGESSINPVSDLKTILDFFKTK